MTQEVGFSTTVYGSTRLRPYNLFEQTFSSLSEVKAIWERVSKGEFDNEAYVRIALHVENHGRGSFRFELSKGHRFLTLEKITLIDAVRFFENFETESSIRVTGNYQGGEMDLGRLSRISQAVDFVFYNFCDQLLDTFAIGMIQKLVLSENTLSVKGLTRLFDKIRSSDKVQSLTFGFTGEAKELRECLLHAGSIKEVHVTYDSNVNLVELFQGDTPFKFQKISILYCSILPNIPDDIFSKQPYLQSVVIRGKGGEFKYNKNKP